MPTISTVLIGNDTLLQQCAEMLLDRGDRIEAVVTDHPGLVAWAQDRGLPLEPPGPDLAARLAAVSFDWLLSIANLTIIPEDVLRLPTKGAVNFHDAPLPRHAGLNAPVWALIEGDTEHGITWHMIDEGVDLGDILVTRAFPITGDDTALTLNSRAFEAALESFPELLDQLETGAPKRRRQNLALRTYHGGADRPMGHGLLDFAQPVDELERLVRALDYGPYWNPMALPKFVHAGEVWIVGKARPADAQGQPGVVLATDGALRVACAGGALDLTDLRGLDGQPVEPGRIARVGDVIASPEAAQVSALAEQKRAIARSIGFWRDRLARMVPAVIPGAPVSPQAPHADYETQPIPGPVDLIFAAAGILARRLDPRDGAAIGWRSPEIAALSEGGFVSGWVPVPLGNPSTAQDWQTSLEAEISALRDHGSFATDLPLRDPDLGPVAAPAIALSDRAGPVSGAAMTIEITDDGAFAHIDPARIAPLHAGFLIDRLTGIANAAADDTPLSDIAVMGAAERSAVLEHWNKTGQSVTGPDTMHAAFEAQVDATPNATALIFEAQALRYGDLEARANRAAHVLRDMGVGPGSVVALCTRRGADMVAGALAILKAGGAYLPMDPGYPADRLRHMLTDSGAQVVVTHTAARGALPDHDAATLSLDTDARLASAPETRPSPAAASSDLAYLIYTSGSTGKPKGVMVEHGNVINFYTAMDAVIDYAPGDAWLAVTSLSFDISVLELFWTTARGLTAVIAEEDTGARLSPVRTGAEGGMDFSLYYWGNDDGAGRDKYRLLLEGAAFADANGFAALWTPDRHFHAFGGPYPNPSITGAAVAAITKRIAVRGGSVVAPLHHPARIAEEWAVIDNLTNGRAGIAMASGWQPDDFILRPENTPPSNKAAMIEAIDQVRRLWRGEAVAFPRADGTSHAVVSQPRPVSAELPVWVTTAGNPETWREAGAQGCHVLTHLLGQSIEEVGEKIALYHAALREAGHDPAAFSVTLMLHAFVSDSRAHAREIARGPMKSYLRAAAGLIKQYAWAFPAFKRPEGVENAFDLTLDDLSETELDAILDFAFERYFTESGLFGTVEDAVQRVAEVKAIGVTEIACLIDYGIDRDTVLDGLAPLARVVAEVNAAGPDQDGDYSIAAQIRRHKVRHLQCTPSLMRILMADDAARAALPSVSALYLGGEALPGALLDDIASVTQAPVTNLYGPTETTIWSTAAPAVTGGGGTASLGHPIANTQVYVLDDRQNPVPLGEEGELWIGGAGVTQGYWQRSEMTRERFVENPFHGGRMYRTGDIVRRRGDGQIDYIGRADHQVKLRGYRIELGEIEAALDAQEGINQAVVIAREDAPGDGRLVAYYTGTARPEAALRRVLAGLLPSFMVPTRLVHLAAFPLTPNKKIDRGALPDPAAATTEAKEATAARPEPAANAGARPAVDARPMATRLAAIWTRVLGVQNPSVRDNFFALGGHSLLAIQLHRAMRDELGVPDLSITDVFRFPQLGELAERVATLTADTGVSTGPAAAAPPGPTVPTPDRKDAVARRRAMRARRGS